jgi:hypothetical protein
MNFDKDVKTLEDFGRIVMDEATKEFLKKGHAKPVVVYEDSTGSFHSVDISMGMTSPLMKQVLAMQLKKAFAAVGATRYAMVSEAWALDSTATPGITQDNIPQPSTHPDRVEVISVMAEGANEELMLWSTIRRNAAGKPTHVDPPRLFNREGDGLMGGIFSNLLPRTMQ